MHSWVSRQLERGLQEGAEPVREKPGDRGMAVMTRNGKRGLLELEFPGLLVLRLLQVLPYTDVLVMLVLDLRLHRLQLGV